MQLRHWVLATTLSTFLLMLIGAYVVKTGAGLSCPEWPACTADDYLPPFHNPPYTDAQILSEWTHRLVAALTGVLTAALFLAARRHRDRTDLWTLSISAVGLLFAQILMGAATVRLQNAPWTVVVHQGLAMAFFGVLVALLTLTWRASPLSRQAPVAAQSDAPAASPPRRVTQVLGDYVSLTKPRVLMLLLVSAATSMLIAVGPRIDPWTVAATLLGGAMASGAGSAFNQWWEKDIDQMMARTANRPVASGRLPGSHVLAFSLSLALGSFMVLGVFVNLLAATLALAGGVFYVVVYTLWLKRATPQNIVIGGAAGSFPALVGWAAATGTVEWPALILGFIVFLWTPPHFWSLALVYKQDYARAGVPMMPVTRGEDVTRQQIFLYSVATLLCASSLWLFGVVSDTWFIFSLALSAVFVVMAFQTLFDETTKSAYRLFRFSILYLGLLFLSLAVDRILAPSTLL